MDYRDFMLSYDSKFRGPGNSKLEQLSKQSVCLKPSFKNDLSKKESQELKKDFFIPYTVIASLEKAVSFSENISNEEYRNSIILKIKSIIEQLKKDSLENKNIKEKVNYEIARNKNK